MTKRGAGIPAPCPLSRRHFVGAVAALATARSLVAAAGGARRARIGVCTFSCHQHWKAAGAKDPAAKFAGVEGFLRYARELGAEGVQTGLRERDAALARKVRTWVEETGSYYEGELRLPKSEGDLAGFETDVRLAREAGAAIARAVCLSGRRYESFQTLEEFRRFRTESEKSLALAEPVLRRHRLKLALENHKDFTAAEQIALLRRFDSEWLGVLVDTGNNIALLEEPHDVVDALAPLALSVHFKDMAVQPAPDGFLLSEVPLGTGFLDLGRVAARLLRHNPAIVFNLEMATRDPLRVPCRSDGFWATFPERRVTHLEAALARVLRHPLRQPPPVVTGKSTPQILAEEEKHNRQGLAWMKQNLPA